MLRTQNKETDEFQVAEERFTCSASIAVPNTWHHVALSIESDGARLYVDGKETSYDGTVQVLGTVYDCSSQTVDMFPILFESSNENDWIWGASNDQDQDNNEITKSFDGYLDHLRFRSVSMSQGQAQAIYSVLTAE